MWPSHMRISLSKYLKAYDDGWWIVAQIVWPFSLAIFYKILQIFTAVKLSNPDVGSSSKTTLGSVINSTPIAVLFRSPPDIIFLSTEPTWLSATSVKPKSLISLLTFLSYSYSDIFSFSLAAKVIASLTVKY